MKRDKTVVFLAFIAILVHLTGANAETLDKIQVIKIAPRDSKAVIKGADGKLQLIKPGDVILEGVTVKEIALGLIVLEEKTDRGPESVIVRIENNKQRIERTRKQPKNSPVLVVPEKREK